MNVVVISDFAHIEGGATRIAIATATALARSGVRVWFFTAVGPIDPALAPPISVVFTGQHDIFHHPSRRAAAVQGLWNQGSARKLDDLLATLDPKETVVHVHTWTKALSSSIMQPLLGRGFQTIMTLHDYFSACPNGGFFNFQTGSICHLEPMSGSCFCSHCDSRSFHHKWWRVARQAVQRRAGIPMAIKHFIAPSDLCARVLSPYLAKDARLHRLPNPVSFERRPRVDVQSNMVFACVGRLSPEKGVVQFAEVAQSLGLKARFIGDGPLRQNVAATGAEVTGWLDASDVVRELQQARALVFPSLWFETFGLTVSEALSLGVPCIVSNVTAARELVIDGTTGLLFDPDKAGSLRAQLERMQSPAFADTLGGAAYDMFWKDPLTIDRYTSRLLSIYGDVLA